MCVCLCVCMETGGSGRVRRGVFTREVGWAAEMGDL